MQNTPVKPWDNAQEYHAMEHFKNKTEMERDRGGSIVPQQPPLSKLDFRCRGKLGCDGASLAAFGGRTRAGLRIWAHRAAHDRRCASRRSPAAASSARR